ncbi:MAG: AhpC/TSA family protein [Pedobacter sp.]|nr:MAG: AhpC/TSA family protein [Pedobacter sp.]
MKKGLVIFWLALLFAAVCTLFWYNDWVYQLPTPVPKDYSPVSTGKFISLKGDMKNENHKPMFLHFFNPDCPCSRFNIKQVNALMKQYSNEVDFRVVVMSDKKFTEEEIQKKFSLNVPVSFDASLAKDCGVYSTPQAVLLGKDQKMFYRGNYNASRYCTDEKTNFAKIAVEGVLRQERNLKFNSLALQAYGCSLPGCNN